MARLSIPRLVLGLMTLAMTSSPTWAGDPTGMWLSQDGDVKMKVARCGDAICSTIAWLKNPNDEKGKPKVDNAEDGKTYSGSFALSAANKADLKGCVAIICKTKTWTRTN